MTKYDEGMYRYKFDIYFDYPRLKQAWMNSWPSLQREILLEGFSIEGYFNFVINFFLHFPG